MKRHPEGQGFHFLEGRFIFFAPAKNQSPCSPTTGIILLLRLAAINGALILRAPRFAQVFDCGYRKLQNLSGVTSAAEFGASDRCSRVQQGLCRGTKNVRAVTQSGGLRPASGLIWNQEKYGFRRRAAR